MRARQAVSGLTLEARALAAIRRTNGSLWGIPSSGAGLFTDSAGTIPATNVGDVLGLVSDRVGNRHATQSTQAAKPVISTLSGARRAIRFDGSGSNGDFLTASGALQYAQDHWVCLAAVFFALPSSAVPQMPYSNGNITGPAGRVAEFRFDPTMRVVWTDNAAQSYGSGSTSFTPQVGVPFVATMQKSASSFTLRANGAQIVSQAIPSSLVITSTVVGMGTSVRTAGNFGFFNGQLIAAHGQGTLQDTDRALIERYLAQQIGASLGA